MLKAPALGRGWMPRFGSIYGMWGAHRGVNMYVSGQVLTSVMSVFISRPGRPSTSAPPPPLPPPTLWLPTVPNICVLWNSWESATHRANRHAPCQKDRQPPPPPHTIPGPPTHSVDLIQETTNTPTQLFSHRGLVFLTSADYIKTLSGVVFSVRLGPQSFTVILFYISVTISTWI